MVKLAFSDKYLYTLPEGHRFPIEKYELVKQQLVYEGTVSEDQLFEPGLATDKQILRVHDHRYWSDVKNIALERKAVRKIGLPVTPTSVNRARNSVAGTIQAGENAMEYGIGINLAGGTHHAYADSGEGFCVLNDIAIAAMDLLTGDKVKRVLIVDLDVHQGNGSAKIFENDERVFTFSMHGENNYPLHKEKSDLDIALPYRTGDDEYLTILKKELPALIDKVKPDIVFFQAGVDVLATDRLGKLGMTRAGVKTRDGLVVDQCKQSGIPLAITMGGGYSRKLSDLVEAHCNTFRVAINAFQ